MILPKWSVLKSVLKIIVFNVTAQQFIVNCLPCLEMSRRDLAPKMQKPFLLP